MLIAGAMTMSAEADNWDISGFNRVLLENGDRQTNLWYPEMVVTAKNGDWTVQVLPDLILEDAGDLKSDINIRAHTLTAAYDFGAVTVKGGVLPPFGRRMTGNEFDGGMMGAYLSDQLSIQGGVIGAQVSANQAIADDYTASWHVMGGTKDQEFSEFGNPNGPGFDAAIVGAGFDISGDDVKAGYNYTNFGAGPAGTAQEVHYMYAVKHYDIVPDVKLSTLGEVRYTQFKNVNGFSEDDTHYAALVQATGTLKDQFGWRVAGGVADDVPAVEAFVTYKDGRWSAQLGGGVVDYDEGHEFIGNMVLKRDF